MDDTTSSENESSETEPGEVPEEAEKENRYKSSVWKHFLIANKEKRLGRCKLCHKKLSYRTSITNLKKHLANAHKVICDRGLNSSYIKSEMIGKLDASEEEGEEQTIEEITYLEEDLEEEEVSFDKRKILRNGAWEYYVVTDEAHKVATCTLCHEELSYRTTSTNLSKHLQRKHFIEFERVTLDEDGNAEVRNDSDDKNDTASEKKRSKVSAAWEYFTVTDATSRVATCKLCDAQCSFYTSVSNLMKHVRRKHMGNEDDEQLYDDEMDESKQELLKPHRSSVWLYFKCIDKVAKVSMCLICKKQLSYLSSITNLKRHLMRKHPGVKLKGSKDGNRTILSSDGQLYEVEESTKLKQTDDEDDHDPTEPMERNTIYVNDYEGTITDKQRERKPAKSRKRFHDTIDINSSSEDEMTFQRKYARKKEDSLDQFGKYIASLLKQLPKELSNQLQADFVKQVMASQLSYESQKVVMEPNNGYAITITESRPEEAFVEGVACAEENLIKTV